jgi:hypothetical protein
VEDELSHEKYKDLEPNQTKAICDERNKSLTKKNGPIDKGMVVASAVTFLGQECVRTENFTVVELD